MKNQKSFSGQFWVVCAFSWLILLPLPTLAAPSLRSLPPEKLRPPQKTYGSGAKELTVDAAQTTGQLHSLLGVNRGPISFPRRPGERETSHVENYKRFGIDLIRTHDFYGPTDWWTLFPKWDADPLAPASYNFKDSDTRIRAIFENGFGCFYRLGTSWRGRELRPINDPPGTIRDAQGSVTHTANTEDFRKWAQVSVQTVRHYTEGWKDGFKYPITYWEIWNEPDLREQFWTGTPRQFHELFGETAKALKRAFPQLKIGGPGCTGAFREAYVEALIRYCKDNAVPLDFYSWHDYGRPGEFNPYNYFKAAKFIRQTLDKYGFTNAENICTEWNAGINDFLFSGTPSGAAFYASSLACMLDGGVTRAFQYCGDRHPGLGLHDLQTGEPKISAWAFAAWKHLLETPNRLAATGSDERGYHVVAGKDPAHRHVRVLISDFQSAHDTFRLRVKNLPWPKETTFKATCLLLDATHRLEAVETKTAQGQEWLYERSFGCGSVCVLELEANK